MDFLERRLSEIEKKKKQVERDLEALNRKVDEVDTKIRAYLADRRRNPHPRYLELIEKVQGYRIDPAVSDKHLETMLDNLQWKVYYNKKAWHQLWENAENARRTTMASTGEMPQAGSTPETVNSEALFQTKSQYSIDTLWEIQQEKLKAYGHQGEGETKSDFKKRMIEEYRRLNENRQYGQEIVMTYDKNEKRCRLDLKER